MKFWKSIQLVAIIGIFNSQHSLWSQAGGLDQTFGDNGFTTIDLDGRVDGFNALTQLPDGCYIAVGNTYVLNGNDEDFIIMKFDENGKTIDSFGGNGMIRGNIFESLDEAVDVIPYDDNHILIVINSEGESNTYPTIAKFSNNGQPDSSFGSNGLLTINRSDWVATSIINDPELGIFVLGVISGIIYCAKVNSNGTLDTLFADQGIFELNLRPNHVSPEAICRSKDGHILISGSMFTEEKDWQPFLLKINSQGQIDSTFGEFGMVYEKISDNSNEVNGMTCQSDGKIVLVGGVYDGSTTNPIIIRYHPDGQLDSTFGVNGSTVFSTTSNDYLYSVYVNSSNYLLAAGDQAIIKLSPDGLPDAGFGTIGGVSTFPRNGYDMILDEHENMIIAGAVFNGGTGLDAVISKYSTTTSTPIIEFTKGNQQIKLYPNPTAQEIWITSSLPIHGNVNIDVFNVLGHPISSLNKGKLVGSTLKQKLELPPGLSPGVYFIRIESEELRKTFKFEKR